MHGDKCIYSEATWKHDGRGDRWLFSLRYCISIIQFPTQTVCFSNWNIVFSFCLRQAAALLFHFELIASVNSFKSFYWNFKLSYAAKITHESTVEHIPNQFNGEAESKFYHDVCVRGGLSLAQPYIYRAKKWYILEYNLGVSATRYAPALAAESQPFVETFLPFVWFTHESLACCRMRIKTWESPLFVVFGPKKKTYGEIKDGLTRHIFAWLPIAEYPFSLK